MSQIPFPGSAVDGSTFFHDDKVCLYHEADNTWECRTVQNYTPKNLSQDVYITTSKVYTLEDKRTEWQTKLGAGGINFALPTVRTQEEVNDAIMELLCYVQAGPTYSVDYATETWVQENYAPVNHQHPYATEAYVNTQIANITMPSVPDDIPTRAEFNSLVTTVMAAIAGLNNN